MNELGFIDILFHCLLAMLGSPTAMCAVVLEAGGGQEQCSIMQRLHNQTKKYLIQILFDQKHFIQLKSKFLFHRTAVKRFCAIKLVVLQKLLTILSGLVI